MVMFGTVVLAILLIFSNALRYSDTSVEKVYRLHYELKQHSLYEWRDVSVTILNQSAHYALTKEFNSIVKQSAVSVSNLTSFSVQVSLTTISHRVDSAYKSIYSILGGSVRPTQCYLFISLQPHLYDKGIVDIPENLLVLVSLGLLKVVYTDNIGPHRKLLPILSKYYHDPNALLVTVDDDRAYLKDLVYNLLAHFEETKGLSVIAMRARLIGLCRDKVYRYTDYLNWIEVKTKGVNQKLLLPVGTGGVLYRPQFFHPVVFSPVLRNLTSSGDDLIFRLACMAKNISVAVGCSKHCSVDIEGMASRHSHDLANRTQYIHSSEGNGLVKNPYEEKVLASSRGRRLFESLHAVNRQGKNNIQFEEALGYLSGQGVLDFNKFIAQHYTERDEKCYLPPDGLDRPCSMLTCDLGSLTISANGPVKTVNFTF